MPSRLSWPMMGGPTAHTTEVTLASGDPSNRFNCTLGPGWELSLAVGGFRMGPRGGSLGLAHACCWRWCWRVGRAGHLAATCPSSSQKEAAWWAAIRLATGKAGEGSLYPQSRG